MTQLTRRELLAYLSALGAAAVSGTALHASDKEAVEVTSANQTDFQKILPRLRTPNKHPELVIAPSFKKGEFDSHAADVPFVFRHEKRFYMTYVGWDGIGYRTGLASSGDLLHWRKEGLILDRGPKGSVTEFNVALTWIVRDNELFGPGTLRLIDGRYVGTYHAYPSPGYEVGPGAIGICTSDDLRHWRMEGPCLIAADGAEWENGGMYKSSLVEHRGTYYMFYNAKDHRGVEQTGVATSKDLKEWKRYDGNPIVPVGSKGAWDDRFASDPCVVKVGDVWAMFYYGLSTTDHHARDGVAFSRDLLHWTKADGALIDVGKPGSIDSQYAHKPSVFALDGKLFHYYCAVAPNESGKAGEIETGEIRGIGVATG